MKKNLLNIVLIAILMFSVVNFISMRINISQKDNEINNIEEQIRDQKIKNNEYGTILADENLEDFYKSIAENDLGYALNDEIIYVDITGY